MNMTKVKLMTPAQQEVQRCLDDLRHMLSIPCPACTYDGDAPDYLPCYCFDDLGHDARLRLKEAKKVRKCEKLAANKNPSSY